MPAIAKPYPGMIASAYMIFVSIIVCNVVMYHWNEDESTWS